jgi:putative proteasome-type protease
MTYCLALYLDDGLVFASDSRTNAGVDYVTTYSKMRVFTPAPDRLFMILSAGNLATTQEVINHIQRDLDDPNSGANLANVKYLFEAAEYLGRVSLQVQQEHSGALTGAGISGETTLLLGGQIAGQEHGLMMIYPQGNYIAATRETPYLQIGESKYGKPALDRIIDPRLTLTQGAQLCLVSLDGTSRSNISVGPPFEVSTYPKNRFLLSNHCRFEESNPYLVSLREAWNNGIRQAFLNLPPVPWEPTEPVLQQQRQQQQATPAPFNPMPPNGEWPPRR